MNKMCQDGTRMIKPHHPQVQVLQKPGNGLKEVLLTTVSACLIPAQLLYPTTLLCKRKSRHFLYIKLDVSKLLFFIYLYYRTRAPKFELKRAAVKSAAYKQELTGYFRNSQAPIECYQVKLT